MSPVSKVCKDCHSPTRPANNPGPRCATCHRNYLKAKKKRDRALRIKRTYNIEPEEMAALIKYQKGKCGVCGKPLTKSREPDIDHDHRCCPGPTSCGKCVRGVAHGRCNRFLAYIEDNLESASTLMDYLADPPLNRMREGR